MPLNYTTVGVIAIWFFVSPSNLLFCNFCKGGAKNFHKNATPHNSDLEPEVEAKLKIQFGYEIELYNFCKQRLYKQYIAIKKQELMKQFSEKKRFPFNILE